ncbi:hypothetical protein HNY73_011612 [Argiope bruennichi]|uniref:Uncharacterized protein n=1 Tax=Argiope bruennichi TaxID=94029 RepID=A0A8T0EZ64_ARGBR|nr:hypothetical protein HNY73_011612 [Argiope bruennichi]
MSSWLPLPIKTEEPVQECRPGFLCNDCQTATEPENVCPASCVQMTQNNRTSKDSSFPLTRSKPKQNSTRMSSWLPCTRYKNRTEPVQDVRPASFNETQNRKKTSKKSGPCTRC